MSDALLDLEAEVHALFVAKLREFAAFCAKDWQMSEADIKDIAPDAENPASYRAGYNAALSDGIACALDFWCEETGYT